jgi:hypothetical protein
MRDQTKSRFEETRNEKEMKSEKENDATEIEERRGKE